jgi:hypothetical protein
MSLLFKNIGDYRAQLTPLNCSKIIAMAIDDYNNCHDVETIEIQKEKILYCLKDVLYSLKNNCIQDHIHRFAEIRKTQLMNLEFERKAT